MSTLITISTFKKNRALEELIETLIANDYHIGNTIVITDDSDNFEALPIYNKYRKDVALTYLGGGANLGIAKNKNRGIKFFLEKPQYSHMLSLDDDLLFVRPGLIEHLKMVLEHDNLPFITGLWTDFDSNPEELTKQYLDGKGWFETFPPIASTLWTTFHQGCHGCLVFYPRKTIERVGYMNPTLPHKYGFEHSLYCSRILAQHALNPQYFAIMKYSTMYFHGNKIPNNYEVNQEEVFATNGKQHADKLNRVFRGYDHRIEEHGLKAALKKDKRLESP